MSTSALKEVDKYLDRKETSSRNVDTVCVLEVSDGSTDCGFQLEDRYITFTLLVGTNCLLVGNDFHLQLTIIDDSLDGFQIDPDIVCVEVLELFNALEFLDVIGRDLSDFEESYCSIVVNDGTTLDIRFCLIGQFHDVLGFSLDHVLKDIQVDDRTEIVDVANKDDLLSTTDQVIEGATVGESIKDVAVTRWIPGFDAGVI